MKPSQVIIKCIKFKLFSPCLIFKKIKIVPFRSLIEEFYFTTSKFKNISGIIIVNKQIKILLKLLTILKF